MRVAAELKSVVGLCWPSKKNNLDPTCMMFLSIQELEAAINYWRAQSPSHGEELRLCPEAALLAKPYALMIVQGSQRIPLDVLDEAAKLAIQTYLTNRLNPP